jgi:hypothetical protein
MSRSLSLMGLVVLASFGMAGCHSGGPSGDPGDTMGGMGGDGPMMYQAPTPSTACTSLSVAAKCSPIESR